MKAAIYLWMNTSRMNTSWMNTSVAQTSQPETPAQPTQSNWLSRLGQQLMKKLTQAREPQIWQSCDPKGNSWWCVYNPDNSQSYWFDSEEEVRIWLDSYHLRG